MLELHPTGRCKQHSGGSRGGARPPPPSLFLDQTEARRAEKKILETGPPPLISGSG